MAVTLAAVALLAATVLLRGARLLVRLCARAAVAAWRRLGTAGRLIVAAGLAWPLTQAAQGARLLAPGWPVTALVSAALVTACLLGRAAVGAAGRWRWRNSGGRAWNRREHADPAAARNAERLDEMARRQDDLEGRLYEVLSLMAADGAPTQRTQLRVVRGGLDEAG